MYQDSTCLHYSHGRRCAVPERNFAAAFFHMVTIALLCTSLAQMGWFRVRAAGCPHHLAVYQFFDIGYFETHQETVTLEPALSAFASGAYLNLKSDDNIAIINRSSNGTTSRPFEHEKKMVVSIRGYHSVTGTLTCITPRVVLFMRLIVALALLAIVFSLCAFLLDIMGPPKGFFYKSLRWTRRNSLLSILTVIACVSMVTVSYYVTLLVSQEALSLNLSLGTIQVAFEYGFYTMTAAGAMAVVATACNLLQFSGLRLQFQESRSPLVEEWDHTIDSESLTPPPVPPIPLNASLDPPPPYAP